MTSDQLRNALINRDFDQVQSLIGEWRKSILSALTTAPSAAERCMILDDARAFGEEHLYLARVVRAHIATELQANSASFVYAGTDLEQPRWRLQG